MNQSQSAHFSTAGYSGQLDATMQSKLHDLLQSLRHANATSIAELLQQIETIATPQQLNKRVNKLQSKIWHLPKQEQTLFRERLADMLTMFILQSKQRALRLEAAGWLRVFTQAAYLPQPEQTFVTLVTAATQNSQIDVHERAAYLKMIVDCFWPFRYPYPAFTWEVFPANSIFYALAPLLSDPDDYAQSMLIAIFSELPTLDENEITSYLLPVALQWATHSDSERRQRITTILARMGHQDALAALLHLQSDPDPLVQASARRAAEKERRA
ncbi:MAG TPA: HEAT repeat domain-containing protein [Ktedonobacteraceae bacterium]|nr:HEAT repeat domain-containing protein [Ktedonobacteraceae bacterium]